MSDSLTVSSTLSEISTALHEYSSASNWWDSDTISDEILGSPFIAITNYCDWLGTKRIRVSTLPLGYCTENGIPA